MRPVANDFRIPKELYDSGDRARKASAFSEAQKMDYEQDLAIIGLQG